MLGLFGIDYLIAVNLAASCCLFLFPQEVDVKHKMLMAIKDSLDANVGPALMKFTERSPNGNKAPLVKTVYYALSKRRGIMVVRGPNSETRHIYNERYGFRVSKAIGVNNWQLIRIYDRGELIGVIKENDKVTPTAWLDLVLLKKALEDPSFVVEKLSEERNGERRMNFISRIDDGNGYLINGGELVIDKNFELASFKLDAIFAENAAVVCGVVSSNPIGTQSRITTSINGNVVLERTLESIGVGADKETDYDDSAYLLSGYGFPEPPVERSWLVPYALFGICISVGLLIVVFSKRQNSPT
jgi:hypothetical protein